MMQFPVGTLYHIIAGNGAGERALKIQETDPKHYNKSRIIGSRPDVNDLAQLFIVEKTGLEDDSWEIVNCISNYVFDQQSGEIRLKKGKRVADQLFKLQKIQGDFYWIKCDDDDKKAVCLEGIIRYKPFNNNDISQVFKFRPIKNSLVEKSNVVVNFNSGKALDIPFSTFDPDTRLIQYSLNYRFNQRWIFSKYANGYLIRSLFNGLVLDIAHESKEGGSQVITWKETGRSNQLWMPQPAGTNCCYKIASLHAPGMYLCIKSQTMNDYGELQIWDQENPSMYWKIQNLILER